MMTDLDDTLTAFLGSDLDDQTVAALAGYLEADGILVFNAGAPFDWFYARLLRPLITELVARQGCAGQLAQVLLILSGGNQICVFDQGGYRLIWQGQGRDKADGLDELIQLSRASDLVPRLDPEQMMYLDDSFGPGGIDCAVAGKVGIVVNVGPHVPGMPGAFVNLGGGTGGPSRCSPTRPPPCARRATRPRLPRDDRPTALPSGPSSSRISPPRAGSRSASAQPATCTPVSPRPTGDETRSMRCR